MIISRIDRIRPSFEHVLNAIIPLFLPRILLLFLLLIVLLLLPFIYDYILRPLPFMLGLAPLLLERLALLLTLPPLLTIVQHFTYRFALPLLITTIHLFVFKVLLQLLFHLLVVY